MDKQTTKRTNKWTNKQTNIYSIFRDKVSLPYGSLDFSIMSFIWMLVPRTTVCPMVKLMHLVNGLV
jgi:hypothetical protein